MSLFEELKEIFLSVEDHLRVIRDECGHFAVDSKRPYTAKSPYFGGVRSGRRYTAFYLMPMYVFKQLADDLSPQLRERMHGEACFNFVESDQKLFNELRALVRGSVDRIARA